MNTFEHHDAGRLRLVSRMVRRLAAAEQLDRSCSSRRARQTLWVVTAFSAFDELTRGRSLSTRVAAEILTELAEHRILPAHRP